VHYNVKVEFKVLHTAICFLVQFCPVLPPLIETSWMGFKKLFGELFAGYCTCFRALTSCLLALWKIVRWETARTQSLTLKDCIAISNCLGGVLSEAVLRNYVCRFFAVYPGKNYPYGVFVVFDDSWRGGSGSARYYI